MKNTAWIYIALVVLLVGGLVYMAKRPAGPSRYDGLATCLKDKGVIFYGAFWCPHCQAEKAAFGSSASLLPYVECSNPDGQTQNQTCDDAKVESYPTWVFPDGSRLTGEQTPQDLAAKAGCEASLPQA